MEGRREGGVERRERIERYRMEWRGKERKGEERRGEERREYPIYNPICSACDVFEEVVYIFWSICCCVHTLHPVCYVWAQNFCVHTKNICCVHTKNQTLSQIISRSLLPRLMISDHSQEGQFFVFFNIKG